MSEFENEEMIVEEENPVLHLELEDGSEVDCAVIAMFSDDDGEQDYIALVSVEELESDEEEATLLLYRYNEDPEDEDSFSLDNIESEEEYEMVSQILDGILEEE